LTGCCTARLGRGVVAVVPVATSIARVYPFQVVLRARQAGLRRDSGALAEQVRSVTVERIGSSVGEPPAALVAELDRALRARGSGDDDGADNRAPGQQATRLYRGPTGAMPGMGGVGAVLAARPRGDAGCSGCGGMAHYCGKLLVCCSGLRDADQRSGPGLL
jgi:hypothetical protein